MARKDAIEVEGTVIELLPNTMFRVARSPGVAACWHTSPGKCACTSFASCQETKLC
jgi:translation initiation factor IF-1